MGLAATAMGKQFSPTVQMNLAQVRSQFGPSDHPATKTTLKASSSLSPPYLANSLSLAHRLIPLVRKLASLLPAPLALGRYPQGSR